MGSDCRGRLVRILLGFTSIKSREKFPFLVVKFKLFAPDFPTPCSAQRLHEILFAIHPFGTRHHGQRCRSETNRLLVQLISAAETVTSPRSRQAISIWIQKNVRYALAFTRLLLLVSQPPQVPSCILQPSIPARFPARNRCRAASNALQQDIHLFPVSMRDHRIGGKIGRASCRERV